MSPRLAWTVLPCALAACRPALDLAPCADDTDCPPHTRCDRARGYCQEPRPGDLICTRLHLRIGALGDAEGELVQLVARRSRDLEVLERWTTPARGGRVDDERDFWVRQGEDYLVDAFLDVDDNLTCGAGDRVWRIEVQPRVCPALAEAGDPLGRPQDRCAAFGTTGDLDGDGCVDDADIDRLLADYGLVGDLATDLDRDGEVGLLDLTLLLANYCAGDPPCCPVPDGGMAPQPPIGLRGDANCDGRLTADDVTAFALCQDDPQGFAAAHPGCSRANCDVTCDGSVDAADLPVLQHCAVDLQVYSCPP